LTIRRRDFIELQDYSKNELWQILKAAKTLKRKVGQRKILNTMRRKHLALIFEKPSTRTRVSFEIAMKSLGGDAFYLGWNELQLGRGETVADSARVMSRYVDGIMARVYKHSTLEELAKYADVPVINGLSDLSHPVQILADLLTIWEKKKRLEGLKLAYVGDGNNVCNSLLVGCSTFGIDVSVACPEGYEPHQKYVQSATERAAESGSKIRILHEPYEAVKNADIVYTDVFVSMGQDAERQKRINIFLPKYQVSQELFSAASKDAIFMHDLPCHREEEVQSAVIDGDRSAVWDQAENRLHSTRGLLYLLL
jgi:ornithine carbamoyltransferase